MTTQLAELQGTEKQIAYATSIRERVCKIADRCLSDAERLAVEKAEILEDGDLAMLVNVQVSSMKPALHLAGVDNASTAQVLKILRNFVRWLGVQKSAKFWIEESPTVDYMLTKFVKRHLEKLLDA